MVGLLIGLGDRVDGAPAVVPRMTGPAPGVALAAVVAAMLGLRWEDLDFTHRTLYVRRNLVMGQERSPKWGTARDIPLSDRLKDALLRLRTLDGGIDRVLKSSNGGAMTMSQIRPLLERVAQAEQKQQKRAFKPGSQKCRADSGQHH